MTIDDEIMRALESEGPLTMTKLSKITGYSVGCIRRHLIDLVSTGLVMMEIDGGKMVFDLQPVLRNRDLIRSMRDMSSELIEMLSELVLIPETVETDEDITTIIKNVLAYLLFRYV